MSDTAKEQIAQFNSKLNQMRELIEGPEWSQDIYNKVTELRKETRGLYVAVSTNPTIKKSDQQQANRLLKESDRLGEAAINRLKKEAVKKQRPDKKN